MSSSAYRWTVSVVSHGHGDQLENTLLDLHARLGARPHRLILTLNLPENETFLDALPASLQACLEVRRNPQPLGYAVNHNRALAGADSDFLLIADPCLRLPQDIFADLEKQLMQARTGIVSPLATTPAGAPEDNGREVVSPASLWRHYILRQNRIPVPAQAPEQISVDWLAGLFLAMQREVFTQLDGFDSRYFLYCEDVDLCLRAHLQGLKVLLLPQLHIVHAANRDTRHKWRHFFWHVRSLLRLWHSPPYKKIQAHKRLQGQHHTG